MQCLRRDAGACCSNEYVAGYGVHTVDDGAPVNIVHLNRVQLVLEDSNSLDGHFLDSFFNTLRLSLVPTGEPDLVGVFCLTSHRDAAPVGWSGCGPHLGFDRLSNACHISFAVSI